MLPSIITIGVFIVISISYINPDVVRAFSGTNDHVDLPIPDNLLRLFKPKYLYALSLSRT